MELPKWIENKSYDEMAKLAIQFFGLELDEIKVTFPTDDRLREFLITSEKARGQISASAKDEATLGWENGKKHKSLSDEAKKQVDIRRRAEMNAVEQKANVTGKALASPTEVKSELDKIKAFMAQSLDDTEDDD